MNKKKWAEKKMFRDCFNDLLNEDGGIRDGEVITKKQAAAVRAVDMLLSGDLEPNEFVKMFELVRDTLGEKPKDTLAVENEHIVIRLNHDD